MESALGLMTSSDLQKKPVSHFCIGAEMRSFTGNINDLTVKNFCHVMPTRKRSMRRLYSLSKRGEVYRLP